MARYGQALYGSFVYGGLWKNAIYDRTLADIVNRTPKAYCNVSDVQRLDDNCSYLAELFGVSIVGHNVWEMNDFPTESEFARILQNISDLRLAYYTPVTTPATPENPLNEWGKWNDAEQILHDLYTLYMMNFSVVIRTGEAYAGETIGVI
jgi:hypothetical protein